MIKGTLAFGALLVAFFEIIGFQTVHEYLVALGIPVHLTSIQVFELASWAMPVFNAAPPILLWCFSILIILSYVRFIGVAMSKRTKTIYHHRSGKAVSPFVYVLASVFGESSSAFDVAIPVAQVFMFAVVAVAFSGLAATVGGRMAAAALTGHVYGMIPEANVRDSAYLVAKPGAALPAGIREANAHGALALVWLEDKTLYVAPVHGAPKLDTGFQSVFAVERDSIATVKHTTEWRRRSSSVSAQKGLPWWEWLVLALAFGVVAVGFALAYFQQRGQIATISEADGSELANLEMPIGEAASILNAISSGRDVLLTERRKSGTRRVWLRSAAFERGLVVNEGPVREKDADASVPSEEARDENRPEDRSPRPL
jgi:hypothetical protein